MVMPSAPEHILSTDPIADRTAITRLLIADLPSLYQRRAARLLQLAQDNPFSDYLRFAAQLVQAQHQALIDRPLGDGLMLPWPENGAPPLDAERLPRTAQWRELLRLIIATLLPTATPTVGRTLQSLLRATDSRLEDDAQALLTGHFAQTGSDRAPFIWAALSLYWAQLAGRLPARHHSPPGHQHLCPVCRCAPVASVIHAKNTLTGLRYLHCALCESQWHVVRAICSVCEQSDDINYWSLDDRHAAVKAESCGHCRSYLKCIQQEKDADADALADDLATLILDAKLEEQGFSRSGINPFLFPAG